MQLARSTLAAILALGIAGSGLALAQTPPPASSTTPTASTSDDVSTWTKKKWAAAKAKWALEKVKYADCRKQVKEQKLTRTEGLKFTYECMNK